MKRCVYVLVLLVTLFPIFVNGMELPKLYSNKVLLYDLEDEKILYEIGIDERSNIASLTKIMTTITAIENIDDLEAVVTIDQDVLNEIPYDASIAGLRLGMKVTYRDLLYASILPSGADATTALAHNIAGSTKGFVDLMNKKAKELGLTDTHFSNVTGYDIANHYSTPREVLKILLYALENSTFEEIYKTKSYTLTSGLVVQSTLNTYNKFMGADLSFIRGSKTGYTGNAGMCMSAIISTKNREMILITLGAPYSYTTPYNLKDTIAVFDYLDKNYGEVTLFEEGKEVIFLPVEGSREEEYVITVPHNLKKYTELEYDLNDAVVKFEGVEKLSYRNPLNCKIGKLNFYFKDELIASEDVFLEEALHFSVPKFVISHKFELIGLTVLVIFLIVVKKNPRKKKSKKWKRA